jgi:pimeloyl-ACP methyl ester carboxylesterase
MKKKFSLNAEHGNIDGIYMRSSKSNSPLVIITNGMNGFYGYGMFPFLQEQLLLNNISSISYNFSHGGVEGDNDVFTQIDLYEKNCMRLEVEDLKEVIKRLKDIGVDSYSSLFLLSHSLGNYPTVFAAKDMQKTGLDVSGFIFLAPSMTLDFWSKEQMAAWEKNQVLMYENKRTQQFLPLGSEFLNETKQSYGKWSLEQALGDTKGRYLILHGLNDDSIPVEESQAIKEWNDGYGYETELVLVKNANHNFNVKHPFEKSTPEFEQMTAKVVSWINEVVS